MSLDGNTLDPAVQLMLKVNELGGVAGKEGMSVEQRRAAIRRGSRLAMVTPRGVAAADFLITTSPRLRVRRYRAANWGDSRRPCIVYFHGGGWVVGDLDSHDAVCRNLTLGSGCTVVAIDYRRAPEHPFPTPVQDALAAFRWVRDHPLPDDVPLAVAVMGDSAGGNLAAVVSAMVRDLGEPMPIAQGLVYPGTDLRLRTRSVDTFGHDFLLTRADMEWYREQYAPDPDLWHEPMASPLLAADHRGLPPTWVWTAGFDPLRDEGAAYAQKLQEAGVESHHRCFSDQVHGFASMGILPGGVARTRGLGRDLASLMPTD